MTTGPRLVRSVAVSVLVITESCHGPRGGLVTPFWSQANAIRRVVIGHTFAGKGSGLGRTPGGRRVCLDQETTYKCKRQVPGQCGHDCSEGAAGRSAGPSRRSAGGHAGAGGGAAGRPASQERQGRSRRLGDAEGRFG